MFNKKLVFWAACIGILLFGICLITLGSVVPDLKAKFKLDDISSGTLFSIMPIGILAGSLLFGPICDRYGYKLLLAISCVLMCIGFGGIAYANSLAALKFCIFFFGLGGGGINGATNAVVSDISTKNKGADLSTLGIFFGIGALGMPVILGVLKNRFNFQVILASVGVFTLLVAMFFILIKFPDPKQKQGFPLSKSLLLLKDKVILLIAFFLFCQSSFEAIINNWTTLFLVGQLGIRPSDALYALSLFVVGMTFMRILIGSILRNVSGSRIMIASLIMIFAGLILLKIGTSLTFANLGLILLGGGLSGGFPIMLGYVGDRYSDLSGTAFSFVLVIALIGNMLINYGMGLIAQNYGIHHLINVAFLELFAMIVLCFFIFNKLSNPNQS